jgi:hypothetical protein
MNSSADEAKLLLKKWMDESALLIVVGAFSHRGPDAPIQSGLSFRMTTLVKEIDPEGTFMLASPQGEDFVLVSLVGCSFGFDASHELPLELAKLVPPNWDALLLLRFADGYALVLFSLESDS